MRWHDYIQGARRNYASPVIVTVHLRLFSDIGQNISTILCITKIYDR